MGNLILKNLKLCFKRGNEGEDVNNKIQIYSAARLEKLNSPYFCMYIGLSKSQNAMCFLSSNISVFPRKTTFSISRPGINLASPNRLKIDQFHSIRVSHLVSAEKLKYNQLFADLFLVQKSTIAGKLD